MTMNSFISIVSEILNGIISSIKWKGRHMDQKISNNFMLFINDRNTFMIITGSNKKVGNKHICIKPNNVLN